MDLPRRRRAAKEAEGIHRLDVGAALEGDELFLADAPVPVGVDELEEPAHLVLQGRFQFVGSGFSPGVSVRMFRHMTCSQPDESRP